MQRAIWQGHITFGLVNIPVMLYSAEKRAHLNFHLLDSRTKARVRYERINDETGEEVPWDKVVKAFEYEKGNYVVLKEEELAKVKVEASQTINIVNFVEEKSVSYIYFDKPYYLVPGKKGEKGFVLLRETLKNTHKMGIAKVVIRTRQYLAALIPCGHALLLNLLRYSDEIRAADEFDFPDKSLADYKITEPELKLAEQLIAAMTAQWEPQQYEDEYQVALLKMIEEKIKAGGKEIKRDKAASDIQTTDNVVDFIDIIKKSLAEKKGEHQSPEAPRPTKKRTRKTT